MPALIEVQDLCIGFAEKARTRIVVEGASFAVASNEVVGLMGESGCGKSMLASSLLNLLPAPGRVVSGSIRWRGNELLLIPEAEMILRRGRELGLVPQNATAALCPDLRIRSQVARVLRLDNARDPDQRLVDFHVTLESLALNESERVLRSRPAHLSGGMRQRVAIALALSRNPQLLIADEPTSSLDSTSQGLVLGVLRQLADRGGAVLLISHNVDVVTSACHRILVMYAGRIVEEGETASIMKKPLHPYTAAMLAALPPPERRVPGGKRGFLPELPGAPPELGQLPQGCAFAPRCPHAFPRCSAESPVLKNVGGSQRVACFLHGDSADG